MSLKFTKMHGLGNDFMVLDAISSPIELTNEQIMRLSDRRFGIGFDQLLIVDAPDEKDVDFNYRIFNANGGEVGQCGNGARCLARFIRESGLSEKSQITVKTSTTKLVLQIHSLEQITVDMGVPQFEPKRIPFISDQQAKIYLIQLENQQIECVVLSLGNPHAVQFVDDVKTAAVKTQGSELQTHRQFPEGVNAGFAQIIDRSHISARVFERGVGETMACGSGACAIMVAAKQCGFVDDEVKLSLLGGDLSIKWIGEGNPVRMTGPCKSVFTGEIDLDKL